MTVPVRTVPSCAPAALPSALPLVAATLTGPVHGLDLDSKIGSLAEARALHSAMRASTSGSSFFVGRYLSRVLPERSRADLDVHELRDLVLAGFCVLPLQHYAGGEVPYSAQMGTIYGAAAARIGLELGLPEGARLYVDVESPAPGSAPLGFTEAWALALKEHSDDRFVAGLYSGAPGLSAGEVELLREQGYTCAEMRGCGAPNGHEEVRQYGADTVLQAGGYRWTVDRDLLLPGERVGGLVRLATQD